MRCSSEKMGRLCVPGPRIAVVVQVETGLLHALADFGGSRSSFSHSTPLLRAADLRSRSRNACCRCLEDKNSAASQCLCSLSATATVNLGEAPGLLHKFFFKLRVCQPL